MDVIQTPSKVACALATVLLVAVTGGCAWAAAVDPWLAILGAPFFLGALVGALAIRRPVQAVSALVLVGLATLGFGLGPRHIVAWPSLASFILAYVTPQILIGAVCAATLRRRPRARATTVAGIAPWR
jgi:hypothetical protein